MSDESGRVAGRRIGAIYRRMSGWYIVVSLALVVLILLVGYRLARPLFSSLL